MKNTKTRRVLIGVVFAMLAASGLSCNPPAPTDNGGNTNGNSNSNGDDPNGNGGTGSNGSNTNQDETLVKTRIIMDDNTLIMRPQAGDDLIVWGDSETVYYIVPSESSDETDAGIEVPEGERFAWTHFAVAGKKIALVTSLGNVRVYDTATGQSKEFSTSDLLLRNTQMNDDRLPGLTQASGNLFATINDTNQVADGNAIKVIDVAGSDPNAWKVISFPNPTSSIDEPIETFDQVAVDSGSRRVAAAGGEGLYVWDIDSPGSAPQFVEMTLANDMCCINDGVQMQFDGDWILYQQDPPDFPLGLGTTNAVLLNLNNGTITTFTNNPSTHNAQVVLDNGRFGYAQWREDLDAQSGAGMSFRSAIGQVSDAPGSTLASQFDTYDLRDSNVDFSSLTQAECHDADKKIGFYASMCLTPDGSRWFLAGTGPIDDEWDYLQMSTGGEFTDFEDPEHDPITGSVMATDVSCSNDVVAFRALRTEDSGLGCSTSDEWVLGFIRIDLLDN